MIISENHLNRRQIIGRFVFFFKLKLCKVDSDRIQTLHMQALRRILGIRWYDKVSNAVVNERTKLPDVPSLIADRRHSLFGREHTPASQALQLSIEAHTGTPPAADWKRPPGRP